VISANFCNTLVLSVVKWLMESNVESNKARLMFVLTILWTLNWIFQHDIIWRKPIIPQCIKPETCRGPRLYLKHTLVCVEVLYRAWNFWGQLQTFVLNLNTTQSAYIYFASRKGQNISHLTSNHWKQQWAIREAVVWAIDLGWAPRSPTTDDAIRQPALLNMRPATCMQCCVEKSLALEGVRGGWCAQALITPFAKLPKDFAARINTHIGRKAPGSCARHSRNESLVRADAHAFRMCVGNDAQWEQNCLG
jgi:hypothetical protein